MIVTYAKKLLTSEAPPGVACVCATTLVLCSYALFYNLVRMVLYGIEGAICERLWTVAFYIPLLRYAFTLDVAFPCALIGFLLLRTCRARRTPWKWILLVILLFPIMIDIAERTIPYSEWNFAHHWFFWETFHLYAHARIGATGAIVGAVLFVAMLVPLAVSFAVIERKWPTYSLRTLLSFLFIFLFTVSWGFDYLALCKRTLDNFGWRWVIKADPEER